MIISGIATSLLTVMSQQKFEIRGDKEKRLFTLSDDTVILSDSFEPEQEETEAQPAQRERENSPHREHQESED